MKRTYTGTLFHTQDLYKAIIKVDVYNGIKWEEGTELVKSIEYTGVTSWDIIEGGKEAEEIEAQTDIYSHDENHEYLVLHFMDGTTSTFRNSYVSMFIF